MSEGVNRKGSPLPHVGSSPPPVAFFLPGTDARACEPEYARLQACAERATGAAPTGERIHGVACRLAGRDCTLQVGEPHPVEGTQVLAIIDLGRHMPYGVFTAADREQPVMLLRKRVYSVTVFGAGAETGP